MAACQLGPSYIWFKLRSSNGICNELSILEKICISVCVRNLFNHLATIGLKNISYMICDESKWIIYTLQIYGHCADNLLQHTTTGGLIEIGNVKDIDNYVY